MGILDIVWSGKRTSAKNKPEEIKYDRAMEVAEFILDLYPEIDKTKRDVWDYEKESREIVNEDGGKTYLGWNDGAVVHIGKYMRGWYDIDCHIMARDKKERNNWDGYGISATIDRHDDQDPRGRKFIEGQLKESGVSDKRDLGLIAIDVYELRQDKLHLTYTAEEQALMEFLHIMLARELAPRYGIKMEISGGCCGNRESVEFSVPNLQENNIKNLVEAVRKYNSLISLPEFKNIKEANQQRIASELKYLATVK